MPTFQIVQATKKAQKMRLAIEGPSGSGKTRSALRVADYICKQEGGRFVVVDTEAGSSRNYAHLFDFDVLEFAAPYSSERYAEALHLCEQAGYTVIIIDSFTHEWSGPGGCLTQATQFHGWQKVRPKHNALFQSLIWSPTHIIATMRSKEQHAMETNDRGKTQVVKLGMGAIQDKDAGYEFQAVLTMDRLHNGTVTKYRCDVLADTTWPYPGEEFAEVYYAWLVDGSPDIQRELQTRIKSIKQAWLNDAKTVGMIHDASPTKAEIATLKDWLGTLYDDIDKSDNIEALMQIGQAGTIRIQEWTAPPKPQAAVDATTTKQAA